MFYEVYTKLFQMAFSQDKKINEITFLRCKNFSGFSDILSLSYCMSSDITENVFLNLSLLFEIIIIDL